MAPKLPKPRFCQNPVFWGPQMGYMTWWWRHDNGLLPLEEVKPNKRRRHRWYTALRRRRPPGYLEAPASPKILEDQRWMIIISKNTKEISYRFPKLCMWAICETYVRHMWVICETPVSQSRTLCESYVRHMWNTCLTCHSRVVALIDVSIYEFLS